MVAPVPAQILKLRPRLFNANTKTKQLPLSSPSSAPRNARIPSALNSLRMLPVATGVYPPSLPTTDFRAFQRANSFVSIGLPPLCRLFALFSAFVSFVFNRLQPLFQKHPGGGVSSLSSQPSAVHMRASASPM